MSLRGGHSSADVFDHTERVYACAATVEPAKPHLHRIGNSWGVVAPLGGGRALECIRRAAYEWCCVRNHALAVREHKDCR